MATIQLKALKNTLNPEHPFIIGRRWLTLRAGLCGLSITSIDAPLCDKGNPVVTGNSTVTIPKVWNGDIVIQGGWGGPSSSSAPSGYEDASLNSAIVALSVVCAVAVFAVLGLVVYIGYTKYKKRCVCVCMLDFGQCTVYHHHCHRHCHRHYTMSCSLLQERSSPLPFSW